MDSTFNPDAAGGYRYWMREARLSEEDGHPDAARAAYAYAADVAPGPYERGLAIDLGRTLSKGT